MDRSGDISQQARDSEIFLRDLGEEFSWSISEVVKETSEGHRVFAMPPCKGQLRMAVVGVD